MTRTRSTEPALLAAVGFIVFAFWFVGIFPLMRTPLPPQEGTEVRRFMLGYLMPLSASVFVLLGARLGLKRRRAAGRRDTSAGSLAFRLASAAGALAGAFSLYMLGARFLS